MFYLVYEGINPDEFSKIPFEKLGSGTYGFMSENEILKYFERWYAEEAHTVVTSNGNIHKLIAQDSKLAFSEPFNFVVGQHDVYLKVASRMTDYFKTKIDDPITIEVSREVIDILLANKKIGEIFR